MHDTDGGGGGYLDGEFEAKLDDLLKQFTTEYLKAKGFDEPIEDIGPAEGDEIRTYPDAIARRDRQEAEGYAKDADLSDDVKCFRGICSQIMIDEYRTTGLKKALELMPPNPQDDLLAIIGTEAADWHGAAATRFKTYAAALHWSTECQRVVLNLLLGAFTAYGEALDAMRRNVIETLTRGIDALKEAAEADSGSTTAMLAKIGLAGALGAVTGGTGLIAIAAGAAAGAGGATMDSMIDKAEMERAISGEADEILKSTKEALESVRERSREECGEVEDALTAIADRIEDEKFRRGKDGPEWTGVRLAAPGVRGFLDGIGDFDLGRDVKVELTDLLVINRDHLPDVEFQANQAKTNLTDATWGTRSLFTGELFEDVGRKFIAVLGTELDVLARTVTNVGLMIDGLKKVIDNYRDAESYAYRRANKAYYGEEAARDLDSAA